MIEVGIAQVILIALCIVGWEIGKYLGLLCADGLRCRDGKK